MAVLRFMRFVLIILAFLAAFFPVYINVSLFAKEEVSPDGIRYSRPDRNDLLLEEFTHQDILDLIEAIEKAIEDEPADRSHYEMLAMICYNAGFYSKALWAEKKQLELHSKKGTEVEVIYSNIGMTYLMLDKLEEARKSILKSLKLNPADVYSHQHLLRYHIIKRRFKEAALEMKILSEISQGLDVYHEAYVFAYDMMKDSEMIKLFREAVKANPEHPIAHRKLAVAIRDDLKNIEKNWPFMMEELRKALELDPKDIYTYITIANAYLFRVLATKDKKYHGYSLKWLEKASKINPGHIDLDYAMGNLLCSMKQYDKAEEKIISVINRGRNDPTVYGVLAEIYNNKACSLSKKGERLDKCLDLVDRALFIEPENGSILDTKAMILYKMGDIDEAYDYIKRAIRLRPDSDEVKNNFKTIKQAIKEARGRK